MKKNQIKLIWEKDDIAVGGANSANWRGEIQWQIVALIGYVLTCNMA